MRAWAGRLLLLALHAAAVAILGIATCARVASGQTMEVDREFVEAFAVFIGCYEDLWSKHEAVTRAQAESFRAEKVVREAQERVGFSVELIQARDSLDFTDAALVSATMEAGFALMAMEQTLLAVRQDLIRLGIDVPERSCQGENRSIEGPRSPGFS
jgi:hypothetical protein